MITTMHYLGLSTTLLMIGLIGVAINMRNLIAILMNIELMLIAVNINFVVFANQFSQLDGQIFVFFILAIAACEAAVGLAIFVKLYQRWKGVETDSFNRLRG
jgi:NADH-quinone oxidoreductase subunit K